MLRRETPTQREQDISDAEEAERMRQLRRNFTPGPLETATTVFLIIVTFVCIVGLGLFSLGAL